MDLKDFKEGCYASLWKKIITDLICVLQRILTIDMHAKALIFESVCKKRSRHAVGEMRFVFTWRKCRLNVK